jgi:hypothetical protein
MAGSFFMSSFLLEVAIEQLFTVAGSLASSSLATSSVASGRAFLTHILHRILLEMVTKADSASGTNIHCRFLGEVLSSIGRKFGKVLLPRPPQVDFVPEIQIWRLKKCLPNARNSAFCRL